MPVMYSYCPTPAKEWPPKSVPLVRICIFVMRACAAGTVARMLIAARLAAPSHFSLSFVSLRLELDVNTENPSLYLLIDSVDACFSHEKNAPPVRLAMRRQREARGDVIDVLLQQLRGVSGPVAARRAIMRDGGSSAASGRL